MKNILTYGAPSASGLADDQSLTDAACCSYCSSTMKFIGEKISVETVEGVIQPAAFTFRGERFCVVEILSGRFDTGHGATPLKNRNWRTRRHRMHFRVRTDSGRIFLLYYDYANPLKLVWILDREVEPQPSVE